MHAAMANFDAARSLPKRWPSPRRSDPGCNHRGALSPRPSAKTVAPQAHWASLLQFALSILGMLGLGALAFAAAVGAFFQLTDSSANSSAATSILLSAAGLFFIGLLLFPSPFYAFQHITGRPKPQTKLPGSSFALIIFLLPLALGLGQLISNQNFAWLALPPLHLVTTALAVAWLLWLALRGLQPGSAQRAWGAFGSGLTLTPFFAFAIEITGIVFLLVFVIIYI